MKLPFHLSLSNPSILRALCLFSIACWCGYQQYQIYNLTSGLAGAVNQESIGALVQRLNGVDDRLDQNKESPPVSITDFRVAQQAVTIRIDAVQSQLKQMQESTQAASQTAVSILDIVTLEAKLEGLQLSFQDFVKTRSSTPAPAQPAKPKKSSTPRAESIALPNESPPPFTLVGIEYRGGERFLSVAPTGSTRLNQLFLVRPGETISGSNWRLNDLDDSRAQFSINGTSRIVPIKP